MSYSNTRHFNPRLGPDPYSTEDLLEYVKITDRENGTDYMKRLKTELNRERSTFRSIGYIPGCRIWRRAIKNLIFDFDTRIFNERVTSS